MSKQKGKDIAWAVWPSAWGAMGGVMGDDGLRRIVLPHYQRDELEALLAWEHPKAVRDETPFEVVIQLTRDYFNAKSPDFSGIVCEMPGAFAGQVLTACRTIPYGRTRSYSQLAEMIERPDAARAVAAALGKNPIPLIIPCHRVTYADGSLGGFSAAGGTEIKQRMLDMEKKGEPA